MKDTEFITAGAWLQIGAAAIRLFDPTDQATEAEHRFFIMEALGTRQEICDVLITSKPGKSVFVAITPAALPNVEQQTDGAGEET